ncbi:MAG: NADH-quinone oxidoreductase subunit F [Flavobacteriaceae bacterium]|nr:MAG: NADH-quinone oxidoreductase subunit F [Flavobacteriaceae bacterium]
MPESLKTAMVVGATGLVGKALVENLLKEDNYGLIKVYVRKNIFSPHKKLEVFVVDFDQIQSWADKIVGDHLYITIGTTLKKAGSKNGQRLIDLDYPHQISKVAKQNGVSLVALVSSIGVKKGARGFYLGLKYELEEGIKALQFDKTLIFRPSFLDGERQESRPLEEISRKILSFFSLFSLFDTFSPVTDQSVSLSMIHHALKVEKGVHVFENKEIKQF